MYIHLCIYAYLRVCGYLFSTVNCIEVIREKQRALFFPSSLLGLFIFRLSTHTDKKIFSQLHRAYISIFVLLLKINLLEAKTFKKLV